MTDTTPALVEQGARAAGERAARASEARAAREAELAELVRRVAGGEQAALARLYDELHRAVHALALRIVGEADLAEEVLLDVFLQVWRSAASFASERGAVSTWVMTIARSRALDRRRARAARSQRERGWNEALDDSLAGTGVDPSAAREAAERAHSVRAAIAALPEPQRRAIELAFYPGLSHTEIAERLGEPLGTIKTRIRLGMSKLRDTLKGWEERR
jgi:RNA polymerase sigma-70 factor (ECF subfamily)